LLRAFSPVTASAIDAETSAIAEAMGPIEHVFDAGRLQPVHEIHAANWPGPHIRSLLAAYKAWFYFARIYQDMLYGAVRRTLPGTTGSPTMNSAVKAMNPVGAVLRSDVEGYLEWFVGFRSLRNTLKDGVPAHTRGAEAPDQPIDYGLGITDRDDVLHIIRLRDLAAALRWSAKVADAATQRLAN